MVTTILYSNEKLNWETGTFDTSYLSNNYCYFELIEDNKIDIDIDNMKELEIFEYVDEFNEHEVEENRYEINRLIRAVKQLNKEIKDLKER